MNDISPWIDQLNSTSAAERLRAAEQLAQLGEQARGAAVSLVAANGDDDEQVRQWAASALESLGPPDEEDCAALAALLQHECSDVGYWAATLIGRLQERAGPAAASLAIALAGETIHIAVKERIAWALGRIGPAAAAALPALQQATRGDNARLARLAALSIRQIER